LYVSIKTMDLIIKFALAGSFLAAAAKQFGAPGAKLRHPAMKIDACGDRKLPTIARIETVFPILLMMPRGRG
jgi:hypothetical protein